MIDKPNKQCPSGIDSLVCSLAAEYRIPVPTYSLNTKTEVSAYNYQSHSIEIGMLRAPERLGEKLRHEMLHAWQSKYRVAAIISEGNAREIELCSPALVAAVYEQKLLEDPLAISIGKHLRKSSQQARELLFYADVYSSRAHHKQYEDVMGEVPARMAALEHRLEILDELKAKLERGREPSNIIGSLFHKIKATYSKRILDFEYKRSLNEYVRLTSLVEQYWSQPNA